MPHSLPTNTSLYHSDNRIDSIDFLRAFSLLGIFLTHLVLLNLEERMITLDNIDIILKMFYRVFLFGKFYPIFSFLFGLSFAIQLENSKKYTDQFVSRFLWRLTILFGIGYIHAIIYKHDILQLYAFLGILFIPVRNLSTRHLIQFSISLLALIPFFWFMGPAVKTFLPADYSWNHLNFNLSKLNYYMYSGQLVTVAAMFVLGLLAGKIRLFSEKSSLFSSRNFVIISIISLISTLFLTMISMSGNRFFGGVYVTAFIYPFHQLCLSLCYSLGILLLYNLSYARWVSGLSAVGRIGLTVYFTQSILLLLARPFVIKHGLLFTFTIALILFACQVVIAIWWTRHFKYGPLEWLWRSLTRLEIQPMRKFKLSEQ